MMFNRIVKKSSAKTRTQVIPPPGPEALDCVTETNAAAETQHQCFALNVKTETLRIKSLYDNVRGTLLQLLLFISCSH